MRRHPDAQPVVDVTRPDGVGAVGRAPDVGARVAARIAPPPLEGERHRRVAAPRPRRRPERLAGFRLACNFRRLVRLGWRSRAGDTAARERRRGNERDGECECGPLHGDPLPAGRRSYAEESARTP